jgi:hypothetical protein
MIAQAEERSVERRTLSFFKCVRKVRFLASAWSLMCQALTDALGAVCEAYGAWSGARDDGWSSSDHLTHHTAVR